VLLTEALLDVGARGQAAYQPVLSTQATSNCGMADPDDGPIPSEPARADARRVLTLDALHTPSTGGSMTPPGTGSSLETSPGAAHLTQAERPTNALVVYVRESSSSLDLSAYVDSILDPPRPA